MTTCPNCESSAVVKNGHRNSKQRYRCKDCGRRFVEQPAVTGRPKVDPEKRKADRAAYMRRYRRKKKDKEN